MRLKRLNHRELRDLQCILLQYNEMTEYVQKQKLVKNTPSKTPNVRSFWLDELDTPKAYSIYPSLISWMSCRAFCSWLRPVLTPSSWDWTAVFSIASTDDYKEIMWGISHFNLIAVSPLELEFHIPSVFRFFSVRPQIFPLPISAICNCFIC